MYSKCGPLFFQGGSDDRDTSDLSLALYCSGGEGSLSEDAGPAETRHFRGRSMQ